MLVYEILNKVMPVLDEVREAERKFAAAWADVWVSALGQDGKPGMFRKEDRKLHIDFPCTCEFHSLYMMSEVVELLKEKFDVDEVVAYYPKGEPEYETRVVVLTEENKEKACWGGQCEVFYTIEGIGPTWVLE